MSFTSMDSVWVAGWCSSLRFAWRLLKSSCLSSGRRTKAPVSPWRKLFWEEIALPASVVGPVESWALARLASSLGFETCSGEGVVFVTSGFGVGLVRDTGLVFIGRVAGGGLG